MRTRDKRQRQGEESTLGAGDHELAAIEASPCLQSHRGLWRKRAPVKIGVAQTLVYLLLHEVIQLVMKTRPVYQQETQAPTPPSSSNGGPAIGGSV